MLIYRLTSVFILWGLVLLSPAAFASDCVILLHGLARTATAMQEIASKLEAEGFHVVNVNYPSRQHEIAELAEMAVTDGLTVCEKSDTTTINFVTHSLGGILIRQYLETNTIEKLHRVVMLGPPNQGSEIVDKLKGLLGYRWLNGPAGMQLGTSAEDLPRSLGPITFELGVIAGRRTINLILSQFLPNPDDGKVSVASTQVDGMCAMLVLPVSHALMMRNNKLIGQIISYLETGEFSSAEAENNLC